MRSAPPKVPFSGSRKYLMGFTSYANLLRAALRRKKAAQVQDPVLVETGASVSEVSLAGSSSVASDSSVA